MSVLLGVLFFFGLPLMVWYVIIRATYRIETAGRSAHRRGAPDTHSGAQAAEDDEANGAPNGVPATREFTIFLWSIVASLVSAGVCLTWSPTTMPTWPPPTDTTPYQIVAFMILLVGSASALSCLTPRVYTGAYTAAAGIYAGFAIPFIYLAYQDPTGQSGIGVVILDVFGNIALVVVLSIFGAIRVWWLPRKGRRQAGHTTKQH
ncbi:hypothetical protein I6J22_09335 [Corynebacterium kroppenstedtii]|uniref:Putative membrane protein n=1 Tax=Corynebacterium kroppenstedtii (strain DSM 44385 / JCM 11950 / CIP 105744 / CCUG 35717) TaxID=645127 RepID=C4LKB3_CORK4|nr:hypothetical protein [Corynebacterium kroppenstedtii]ACR18268.1 putative membrane protein [Corynebacterium kroppenstedtii DSM 44385]QRP10379.1 hypothetical protein I6J22_09335 [Corynebacterium kroppenstedtii]HJD68801.1 hypothetical protein [Corynebacterium kroppenstedtii]